MPCGLRPLMSRLRALAGRPGSGADRVARRSAPRIGQRNPQLVARRLSKLTVQQLVALLESPNVTQRDMAHQYVVTHKIVAAAEPLAKLTATGKLPATRLHALCVLDGIEKLTYGALKPALADSHPAVRRQAVRLCSPGVFRDPLAVLDVLGVLS